MSGMPNRRRKIRMLPAQSAAIGEGDSGELEQVGKEVARFG